MLYQGRRNDGRFAAKSEEVRQVRSIRLTDEAWENLGKLAESRSITRADLMEEFTRGNSFDNLPEVLNETFLANKQQEQELEALKKEIGNLTQENQVLSKLMFRNLESIRDAVLFGLKIGKQAPGYKAAQKALNRFIDELIKAK
jgi:predicted DNA-binding ribbon-helix-helix protein